MDKAIDVHDHVIRSQLGRFNGYEVTTEGDAFLMAFHDASDAIAWSIATQQVSDHILPSMHTQCKHLPVPCVQTAKGTLMSSSGKLIRQTIGEQHRYVGNRTGRNRAGSEVIVQVTRWQLRQHCCIAGVELAAEQAYHENLPSNRLAARIFWHARIT